MVVLWHIDHKDKGSYLCTLSSLVLGIHTGHLCYLAISSSATPFSFCLQSFPASGSFPVNRLFASGGQSIGDSASASVLPMNIQGWLPLKLTGLICLQSKGLSRVFSSTTIWKHQFFGTQPSLCLNSHVSPRLLEKTWLWLYGCLSQSAGLKWDNSRAVLSIMLGLWINF